MNNFLFQIGILDDKTIEDKCLTVICESAEEVLCSDSFLQVSVGTLEKVIKEDRLEAPELKIFQACIKWAEVQCQKLGVEVTTTAKAWNRTAIRTCAPTRCVDAKWTGFFCLTRELFGVRTLAL